MFASLMIDLLSGARTNLVGFFPPKNIALRRTDGRTPSDTAGRCCNEISVKSSSSILRYKSSLLYSLMLLFSFGDAGLPVGTHRYLAETRLSRSLQRDLVSWSAAEMQNRLIEWYQEDQFASANLNRVDLFEIKGKRSLLPKSTYELPSQVSCISCNASRGVVAVGQQSGNISFLQSETTSGVRKFTHQVSATIDWIR